MSMYNMMFGRNPIGPALLYLLAINPRAVPRLRDAYLFDDKGEKRICVLTRTGGGNRAEYTRNPDADDQGPTNDDLRDHPLYARDEDARLDSTYARFLFRIPENYRAELDAIPMETQPDFEVRFRQWEKDMKEGRETDDTRRAMAGAEVMLKPLIDKLEGEAGSNGGTGT